MAARDEDRDQTPPCLPTLSSAEALARHPGLIAAFLDALTDGVALRDDAGALLYANPAYDALAGGGVTRYLLCAPGASGVAAVQRHDEACASDTELLKRLLLQARCLLWQAVVTEKPRAEKVAPETATFDTERQTYLDWQVDVVAPEVVSAWLPVHGSDGRTLHDALYQRRPLEDRARNSLTAVQALREEAPQYEQQYRIRLDDGTMIWLQEMVSVQRVAADQWRLVGVCTDVTERIRIEARLTHQSHHDAVTNLANRQCFLDALEQLTESPYNRPGLLYLELTNFKRINDSLGHSVGDRVLSTVADRLRRAVGQRGLVARISGGGFTILLPETTDNRAFTQFAERLLVAMKMPLTVAGRSLTLMCAIGAARSTAEESGELLRNATTALHHARTQATDAVILFEPSMHARERERLETEEALRRALRTEEIRPFYQPIVSLATGETVGMEALARWLPGDDMETLSPSRFIPIAEETGLIIPMGAVLLRAACRDFVRWRQRHPDQRLTLSINVSERQFRQPYFVPQVQDALRETGFPAEWLNLELTESILLNDVEECLEKFRNLNALGIKLTLDDFGTGYSSLSYLSRLPVAALKIDRSFVQSLTATQPSTVLHNEAIVRTIIALARTLRLGVTAEGIETEEQRTRLRSLGADHGQGFLFSYPLSAAATEGLLERLASGETYLEAA